MPMLEMGEETYGGFILRRYCKRRSNDVNATRARRLQQAVHRRRRDRRRVIDARGRGMRRRRRRVLEHGEDVGHLDRLGGGHADGDLRGADEHCVFAAASEDLAAVDAAGVVGDGLAGVDGFLALEVGVLEVEGVDVWGGGGSARVWRGSERGVTRWERGQRVS